MDRRSALKLLSLGVGALVFQFRSPAQPRGIDQLRIGGETITIQGVTYELEPINFKFGSRWYGSSVAV